MSLKFNLQGDLFKIMC